MLIRWKCTLADSPCCNSVVHRPAAHNKVGFVRQGAGIPAELQVVPN